jgi:glycosyltransferase 2 family protein
VLASSIAYGLALRHVGIEAYLLGGGLLLGAITLAQFTPGLPIGTGLYYLASAGAARALGASDDQAAAVAVLSHAATALTHLLVGAGSALAHHDRLRDLLRMRRAIGAASEAPTTTAP